MSERILLAFDGSRAAARAAGLVARRMAENPEISCTVLYVFSFGPVMASFLGVTEKDYRQALEQQRSKMQNWVTRILGRYGQRVEFFALAGDPVRLICDVAAEKGCRQIVLGRRRRSLGRLLPLLSISRQVARRAGCPVEVVEET